MNTKQTEAIKILAQGKTPQDTADDLGITTDVIYKWLEDANFVAELNRCQADLVKSNRDRLYHLAHQAVDRLETMMQSEDDNISLKASTFLVNAYLKLSSTPTGPTKPDEVQKDWDRSKMLKSMLSF